MAEPSREARLRELFDRALSVPPDQREALIASAGDEVLAERLRALLAQDAFGTARALANSPATALQGLRRIGRYELLRELGRGGMGTVLLARQLEPVERLVALKMVHGGGDSQEIERRFAIERQVLARMNHPGIARIFDGGTADDGVPYFVMEYVRGEPITAYCDRRQLDCDARIDLFGLVCEAVQHAHQRAVLHRDLKPGNVLVTEEGGRPQPKVIDFGVARAVAGGLGQEPATVAGSLIGTFAYMSPEQADPSGQDVDTRADVYSLGVMLYELLTGELPLAFELGKDGLLEWQRRLLEAVPVRPSERVRALPVARQESCAQRRRTTAVALQRQLRGDLDWILLRALDKDRNRRYASAADLGADLQRYRRAEPVQAGPPTLRYRVGKFVRRNLGLVVGCALLVLGLAGGLVGATLGMLAARASRDVEAAARARQEQQIQRERAVGDYFEFLLFFGDPGTGSSPPSLRQVLDTLTPTIARRLAERPLEEAAVRAAVGRAYLATGEPTRAEEQLARAWQLVDADANADAAVACRVLHDLSRARRLAGGVGAGHAEIARMFTLGASALSGSQPDLAARLREVGDIVQRPRDDWTELRRLCLTVLDQVAGMPWDDPRTRLVGALLGAVSLLVLDEALPGGEVLLDRLEVVARQSLGGDVDFLQVVGRLAEAHLRLGRFAPARRLAVEVLEALSRAGIGAHWLQLSCERIRGLALALGDEPAAGETALLVLDERLRELPAAANAQARAAAQVLTELCDRLVAADRLEPFLLDSLQRWLQVAAADAMAAPWWPADAGGLPAAAVATARRVVERANAAASSPRLLALSGSLLLREDRAESAAAALTAACASLPDLPPELMADAAIAQLRVGRPAAAATLLAALRRRELDGERLAARVRRAVQRVEAAGGR